MAVAALCRGFSGALRVSGASRAALAAGLPGQLTRGVLHNSTGRVEPLHQCKFLHTSLPRKGLEEFFDDPQNWGAETVKSGDAWTAEQLRGKSSDDLHKLWYVLLKEKNMLLTLKQEAKHQLLAMPSPERLEKVENSMERIDLVIKEREDALRLLQTGQEKPRPGEWRQNFLGYTFWYTYNEWAIPWYMNTKYKRRRYYHLPYVNRFIRLRTEKYLRQENRKRNLEKKKEKVLRREFPDMATQS
uniref:Large ribosomal subunit protein uL29m n=1 Tax=Sphenodon punctatus TaxID=8508 RepID=A0A8D0HGL5_SPHPU